MPVATSALQDDRAGAVAEQHAGAAIVPVEQAGEGLAADHQSGLGLPEHQEVVGDRQRVDEAAAHRLDVECGGVPRAELALHRRGAGREGVVGGRGRDHQQIDPVGADAGPIQSGARRRGRQIRGELALGGDVALADPGALDDPRVAGVDASRPARRW